MGRRRKTDLHLPKGVYRRHGGYHLVEIVRGPDGRKVRRSQLLGRTEAEMWRAYRELATPEDRIRTCADLMDRFAVEILPERPEATRNDYQRALKRLRPVLGHIPPEALRPHHCYEYQSLRAASAPVRANRELAVLAAVFNFAIRLGLVDRNPTHGVRRLPETPRERLPEAWELAEFMKDAPDIVRVYVPVKILTGLRQGDLLRLKREQLTEEGILVREGKRGKLRLIEWSDELKAAVDAAKALRSAPSMLYVFATRAGQPYSSDGFRSIWQRHMRKVLKRGVLLESFTEHDLRAVTATEAKERAQELLAHENARTTKIYQRSKGPRRVRPLR